MLEGYCILVFGISVHKQQEQVLPMNVVNIFPDLRMSIFFYAYLQGASKGP
jgi:hypothetical protein